MENKISSLLGCNFKPIVLIKTDEKPKNAIEPKAHSHGSCLMVYLNKVIFDRKTLVFERDTVSCKGGLTGLGFGNGFNTMDDGIDIYSSFLSTGLRDAKNKQAYQKFCDEKPLAVRNMFEEGERIYTDYDRAYEFTSGKVPIYNNKEKYVVFKPFEDLNDDEVSDSVIFILNPVELSVLIQFDTSLRDEINYTMTPQSSACQSIGIYVFNEAEKDDPHGVLGLLDLAGRRVMNEPIKSQYFTYAVPWKLYQKYLDNAEYSYLDGPVWKNYKK
jgi:hypothetical protein